MGVAVMNKLQARSVAIASSLLGEIAIRIVARWDLAMDLARPSLGVEQTFVADGDDGEYVYMGGRPGAWGRARGCVSVSLWCLVRGFETHGFTRGQARQASGRNTGPVDSRVVF